MSNFKKALVVSDTHRNTHCMNEIARRFSDVDYLFHLGDHAQDAEYMKSKMPQASLHYVKGNCDPGSFAPAFDEVVVMDRRIVLTHGHLLGAKTGYDRIFYYAKEQQADAILFGHTHTAYKEYMDDLWLVNPGSAGDDYYEPPSVAMLVIGEYGIVPKIIRLHEESAIERER